MKYIAYSGKYWDTANYHWQYLYQWTILIFENSNVSINAVHIWSVHEFFKKFHKLPPSKYISSNQIPIS